MGSNAYYAGKDRRPPPLGRWIDADAFRGDDNNLHYPSSENGKVALANAFAKEAIELARATEN